MAELIMASMTQLSLEPCTRVDTGNEAVEAVSPDTSDIKNI